MGTQLSPQKGGIALVHVRCRQTAGWIKTPLGMEVGLGPGNIVSDGDPAPFFKKGAQQLPNFRCIVAKRLDGLRCHVVWK